MAKTLQEKITATEALLAKYRQQEVTEAILNNIEAGDAVKFKFGRGEKARVIDGTVIAVEDTAQGKLAAIQAGEGIDIKVYKVRVADITENPSADARNGETPAPTGDPLSDAV